MVQARSAKQAHRLKIAFALAGVYLVAEVITSFTTGSLALLADAGHMLTDVVGVGLALFAITLAQRPATPGRTYGYHRAEWSSRAPTTPSWPPFRSRTSPFSSSCPAGNSERLTCEDDASNRDAAPRTWRHVVRLPAAK